MIRCPECKRFAKPTTYRINGFEEILDVLGICKKHGEVHVLWDDYDEIVPEELPARYANTNRID